MSRVAIVTDSTSCLPNELLNQYDIGLVPSGLVINNKVYLDQVEMSAQKFWELFKQTTTPITTNAVSPGEFFRKFEIMGKTTENIICILVSRALTASHQAAFAARDLIREKKPQLNIEIVDSETSTGALGYIVLEAARAAQQNQNFN